MWNVPNCQCSHVSIFTCVSNFMFVYISILKFHAFFAISFSIFQCTNFQKLQVPKLQKVRYTDLPIFSEFQILGYEKYVSRMFPYFLVFPKYFRDKYEVRGSRFVHIFGRSRNHQKSIAICPGVKISHLGIVKTPKSHYNYVKKPRTTTNSRNLFAVFWALLLPY